MSLRRGKRSASLPVMCAVALVAFGVVLLRWSEADRLLTDWVAERRQFDKLLHCLIFAGLSAFLSALCWGVRPRRGWGWTGVLLVAVLASLVSVIDEGFEALRRGERFELLDLAADIFGAFVVAPLLIASCHVLSSEKRWGGRSPNREPLFPAPPVDAPSGHHPKRQVTRRQQTGRRRG